LMVRVHVSQISILQKIKLVNPVQITL
jgi:hypothetical protein